MTTLTVSEQLALIKENLAEVLNEEIIESILSEGRPLKIYWGELSIFISLFEICLNYLY
jgi:tyrosyl-tRNA synthetase